MAPPEAEKKISRTI